MCQLQKSDFLRKMILKHITWTEWSEKGSEYYTCKGCEDEVNHKGQLTGPKVVVYVKRI